MSLETSQITNDQWKKVLKALYYSAASGFAAGFLLAMAAGLQAQGIHDLNFVATVETAALIGGVTGAFNAVAVTVKQLFTPGQ